MLMFALVLSACGGGKKEETGGKNSGGQNGGDEKKAQDLIIASLSEAVSLDPHGSNDVPSSNVAYNIYETLVYQNEKMEIVPGLAKEWKMIDDTTYEFKLQEGVKFHDGSDFTADVVKANFERILDPKVASPRAFLFEMIESVNPVDPTTVQFKLKYPFAPFLAHLAHSGGSMISAEAIKKDYEEIEKDSKKKAGAYISLNPSGTGWFKLGKWNSGESIKLVRNDDYWGEKAKLDSVTWKVVKEALTRVAELETGNSHIIDPVSPSDLKRVEDLANAGVNKQTSLSLSYVGFNAQKAPFDNVKVRQAISMAIDKNEIINGIYEGTGVPAVGPLAPDVYGFDASVKPIEYDVEGAKKLLAEAGFPDGFETTIWTNDNPDRRKIAEYVQSALKEIGVEVKIEELEWGSYLEQTAAGNHDMFILGWSTATADADYAMFPLFHSDNVGDPGNRTFLKDAELDSILEKARQETDNTTRLALYKEAQEKLVELAPMLYLMHTEHLNGVSDNVKGFGVTAAGMFLLKDVTIE
ncbi:glutathione ABC transporter substrate-binding protein [Bacillus kwashiorkori]|uniref:glutathione ABC transporter substrate-binding protein n=1 Tax=Bacillus kwashiorkori TaxID=1522318 RepID=UPI00092F8B0F|nr:glutathione ABC transporter substrate-binding protein [Bacillus kwashiorkori]